MPLRYGKDSTGYYIKWGNRGHKYYYKKGSERSRKIAKNKALKQARAIAWRRGSWT